MRISLPENSDADASPLDAANYHAPEIVGAGNAFAYALYQHSKLPLGVFEAARVATAVVNGCLLCRQFRVERDIHQLGIDGGVLNNGDAPDESFYQSILNGDLSPLNKHERLAAEYAQRMGTDPQGLARDDAFWSTMKSLFSDQQITELTYCVAAWMGMGRVAHVLGLDTACLMPEQVT